jgi:26S proteasome regulatory subunit N9
LNDLSACQKTLEQCEKLLGEQDSVEPVVNAGYYGVAAEYYKVKPDYSPYYKHALLYLACVDTDKELGAEDRVNRARDLCIAALLGDTIYNFGELVSWYIWIIRGCSSRTAATPHPPVAQQDRARVDQGPH